MTNELVLTPPTIAVGIARVLYKLHERYDRPVCRWMNRKGDRYRHARKR